MKLFFLILLSFQLGSQTLWQQIPDDVKHVYAGTFICLGTTAITYHYTKTKTDYAPIISCGAGFIVGALAAQVKEEVYDLRWHRGVYSNYDKAATTWGALTGVWYGRVAIQFNVLKCNKVYDQKKKINRYKFNS